MKSPREHALGLLRKAEHDLIAGRATLSTGRATDMVCFHAQQATEKSPKALLALHDAEYPLRDDLAELLELAKSIVPEIGNWEEKSIPLTPFAVEVRYDEMFDPSIEEANSALQTATQVHALVTRIIENPSTTREGVNLS